MEERKDEYVNIKLPVELAKKIDRIIELRIEGYRSRGEFVADAIRRRLDELERKYNI